MDLDLVSDGDFSCVEVFRLVVGQWRRPFHLGPSGPHNEPLGFRSTISKYPINRVGAGLKSWWGWGELSVHVFGLKFREGPTTPRVWIQVSPTQYHIGEEQLVLLLLCTELQLPSAWEELTFMEIHPQAADSVLAFVDSRIPCDSRLAFNLGGKILLGYKALSSTEKHLKSLDSYLGKVHNDAKQLSLENLKQRTESIGKSDQLKAGNGLKSLENYLGKVKGDAESENYVNKGFTASRRIGFNKHSSFLFEIATPVKNSDFGLFSLPMVYGAKINNLILTGEWWRLVTPMFLHSGIFHIALGSWVLFSFGHEVSQKYGSFTFLLIYVLGGISGNLISFLHTSEPTVGGTGPVFAIIGAWLIYQVQNKDVIATNASQKMFHNAIIATALSFVLSNFGPIDDWAHFAAACTGIAYGFVTCPSLQVKDVSPEAGRQERITLVRQYADPCKSLICFSLFLLLLSSSLFIFEPPLYLIE
ncbi:RHOMBOID-like protein 9, chloroplastic [Sesamum angolense]|uniref:RHOMBOID-like protein 9, chloroplastic n=1 Tax=Sesamum angolense TaxID=2727404 RepID=A0AAE1WHU7_9LAMI|nr:RHOMBOID-like protein 9, chloroplastic [Sesamum angolense]